MTRPVVVLVGPPGAGKSTVGRLVAARLQVPFRDTDDDVAAAAGKAVPDIFLDDGEEAFRELEHDQVRRALAEHPGVLSLGGGAVLRADTRERLAGHTVAYLRVGLAEATRRVGLSAPRPVLALNPRAALARLLAERLPLYEQVASLQVDTDGLAPEQVAAAVVDGLG